VIRWHTPEQEGQLIVAAVKAIDLPGLQEAAFVKYHAKFPEPDQIPVGLCIGVRVQFASLKLVAPSC